MSFRASSEAIQENDVAVAETAAEPRAVDAKRKAIHVAAIAQFSARGIRATSMANIADAAGMSRPALYQYFKNKHDIFASAFVAIFDTQVSAALASLQADAPLAVRLDGFLQRFEGDLWEQLAASAHREEIVEAKTGAVAEAVHAVIARLDAGLVEHLRSIPDLEASHEAHAATLRLSPLGLRADQPTVAAYRHRLTNLATSVAAGIDAEVGTQASCD